MGGDWQERANKRHDERHTKVSDEPVKQKSVKNRRDWCRGKVGVKHITECVTYSQAKGMSADFLPKWRVLVCKTCNKHLKVYAPFRFDLSPPDSDLEIAGKPDWVTF